MDQYAEAMGRLSIEAEPPQKTPETLRPFHQGLPEYARAAVDDDFSKYTAAALRVSQDFARRGAGLQDLEIEPPGRDIIMVRFRRGDSIRRHSLLFPVGDVESAVVALADLLQEKEVEEGDTSWPGCLPGHPHPPAPTLVTGRASWTCPRTGKALAEI